MFLYKNCTYKEYILLWTIVVIILVFIPSILFRLYYRDTIYSYETISSIDNSYKYGIVFGAGTNRDGEPNQVLKDRLDSAARLYSLDKIDRILLSGNNDSLYHEVDAMREYLIVKKGIDKNDLVLDGYGYRTYDTCFRSSEVYDIDHAILITSNYHLPRSLYLCKYAGIESVGAAGQKDYYTGSMVYIGREVLATQKALIDTLLLPPDYESVAY